APRPVTLFYAWVENRFVDTDHRLRQESRRGTALVTGEIPRETLEPTMREWTDKACSELLGLRNSSGVWGYRTDRGPSVEATALACLGLLSCREGGAGEKAAAALRRGAEWLVAMQGSDGSLGVSPTLPSPGWATPYAILLWGALDMHGNERQRA